MEEESAVSTEMKTARRAAALVSGFMLYISLKDTLQEGPMYVDLLITDVGPPNGMSGRQLADAAPEQRRGLKVLFITGFAENAAVGNGLLVPGMQVMTKPFSMAAFANRVRSLIEN